MIEIRQDLKHDYDAKFQLMRETIAAYDRKVDSHRIQIRDFEAKLDNTTARILNGRFSHMFHQPFHSTKVLHDKTTARRLNESSTRLCRRISKAYISLAVETKVWLDWTTRTMSCFEECCARRSLCRNKMTKQKN